MLFSSNYSLQSVSFVICQKRPRYTKHYEEKIWSFAVGSLFLWSFSIIAASVYRSVLSLCVWSTTCSSVTVQETPWRRNATCAASSLVTIGPYVHNNRGTCLHFRSQHISPCHFCTEVTCACHCFPLGNLRTATTGTIWHHGWCRKDNRRCSVMALPALMP